MGGRGRGRGRGGGKEKEKGEGERIGRRRERGFRGGIRVKEGEGERISEGGDGGWEMVEGNQRPSVIIRVFDVLYLKRCMKGSVGHMFFGLKLEKFGRLDQNWYKRQQIRVEVGDKVMLEVSSWKEVVHFGKKEMLAPRYKYLADTNLHVHFEEIKVDKTLCFVKEPVEIIDREVKSLKRSRIPIVKHHCVNSCVDTHEASSLVVPPLLEECEQMEIRAFGYREVVMSPPARASRAKFHWGIAFATGLKRFTDLGTDAYDKEVGLDNASISVKKLKKTAKAIPDYTFRDCGNGRNVETKVLYYKGFMACNPKECDGKGGFELVEHHKFKQSGREAAIGIRYVWTDFKALLVEEFCPSNEMEKLESDLVPYLVTPGSSRIKRVLAGFALDIQGMLRSDPPTNHISVAILETGILTDEAVSCGTLTKGNEKRKGVEETASRRMGIVCWPSSKCANVLDSSIRGRRRTNVRPGLSGNRVLILKEIRTHGIQESKFRNALIVNAVGAPQRSYVHEGLFLFLEQSLYGVEDTVGMYGEIIHVKEERVSGGLVGIATATQVGFAYHRFVIGAIAGCEVS
ncbi:hypothetical protein Tco_0421131 [Tanacetum coccineum]